MKKLLAIILLLGLAAGLFACGEKEEAETTSTAPTESTAAYAAQYPYTYKAGGFTIRYYVENGMAFVDYAGEWLPDDGTDNAFIVPVTIDGMPVRWALDADDDAVALRKLQDCGELIVPAGIKAVSMDLSNAETVRLGPDVERFEIGRGYVNRIEVDRENERLRSIDGVLFNKDGTVLLQYPTGRPWASYEIPDGTVAIAAGALWFSRPVELKNVEIPDSVTSFPDSLDDLINTYGYQLTFIVKDGSAAESYFKRQTINESFRRAKEETGEDPFLLRTQGRG